MQPTIHEISDTLGSANVASDTVTAAHASDR